MKRKEKIIEMYIILTKDNNLDIYLDIINTCFWFNNNTRLNKQLNKNILFITWVYALM